VKSIQIVDRDEPLYDRPEEGAARRGAAAQHALLPWYAVSRGSGCAGRWLMVGALAWVCDTRVRLSQRPPVEPRRGPERTAEGLPYRYYFVGRAGSFGYRSFATADQEIPDAQYEPGFALALVEVRERTPGESFGLTSKGLWVPMHDLGEAHPVPLRGAELKGALDVGWVFRDRAPVFRTPGGDRLPGRTLERFQALDVRERRTRGSEHWLRIGDREWVSGKDARAPTPAELPVGIVLGERWIDVELAEQVLTAYEGARPVYAALVSTGKGGEKSTLGTPRGEHRIWVKLRSGDMDNLEDEEALRYYAIQDVPWVMYFARGYGLHGTFWHRSFGQKRSHGCVNLAPLDAEWLFFWSSPQVPAGWTAALPTQYERGTLVRVR
jgi:hypothetical protein